MKRILVLGCCGAGKSTFSKKLQELTKLELFHLDQYYWQPNWQETGKEEWKEIVTNLSNKPSWIIDGNYSGTIDVRVPKADTIFYLDYPIRKCLMRIISRNFKYWHKERPDMPAGCKERFDIGFLHYVVTFNMIKRKGLLKKLRSVQASKKVVVFKNDREADQFLELLS